MFRQKQSPFAAYLRHVMGHLRKLPPEQQDAIRRELHAHMEDAAAEQGQIADDSATQAAIISRLGPGRRLGRELVSAYGLHQAGWDFWLLWVLANCRIADDLSDVYGLAASEWSDYRWLAHAPAPTVY